MGSSRSKWPTLAGNSSFLGFLLQKAWKIVIFLDVANQLRKVWKMVYFFDKCVKWTTLVGNKVIVHFHAFCRRFATESLDNGLLFWESVAYDLQKVWKIIYFLWESVYNYRREIVHIHSFCPFVTGKCENLSTFWRKCGKWSSESVENGLLFWKGENSLLWW